MKATLAHLDFLKELCGGTIKHLSGKNINLIQLFCLGLLRRVYETAVANSMLCAQLEQIPALDYTIGISFRALVLDTLITMNLLNKINELEKEKLPAAEQDEALRLYCEMFLSDGLKQTISYIQDAQTLGFKTAEQTAETFKNFGKVYNPFLDNYAGDGSKPTVKHKDQKTAKQLFETLAHTSDLKEISKLYDSYAYLSKYDHFGIIYYNAINEPITGKIKMYADIAEAIVAHATLVHVILAKHSNSDPFLTAQKDAANKYLLENVIKQP